MNIQINALTVTYANNPVLWNINACIPTGKMLAIVGPNGAGKSTLLKTMVGLITPLAGSVTIEDKPLSHLDYAYVPQRSSVDWDFPLHVIDVVLMGTYKRLGWFRRPGPQEYAAAHAALEKVGMGSLADRPINQLSGGQQQRIFIARALVQDAQYYLMDEPFNAIDATTQALLITILNDLTRAGKTVIVVHHDLPTVKDSFDWTLLLNKTVVSCGPTHEMVTPEMLARTYGHNPLFNPLSSSFEQTR